MRMAGIGFRGAASVASLRDALERANPDGTKIDALVTEAAKARAVFQAAPRRGGPFVDGALGGGEHSRRVAERLGERGGDARARGALSTRSADQ